MVTAPGNSATASVAVWTLPGDGLGGSSAFSAAVSLSFTLYTRGARVQGSMHVHSSLADVHTIASAVECAVGIIRALTAAVWGLAHHSAFANVYSPVDVHCFVGGTGTVTERPWPLEMLTTHPGEKTQIAALTQPQSGTTVCTVTGAINNDSTPVLKDALADARGDDNPHLVIDLSGVIAMDWAGCHALLEARHWHNINGSGHLIAVAPSNAHAISDPYIVVGLQASFEMYDDLAEALHRLSRPRIYGWSTDMATPR
jgi:anti-anti-sigma regulatory factor